MKRGSFYILQVFIKEFFINGILKSFTPIWIDSDADNANDPYTTDCSGKSTATNPHTFTQFEIVNGELTSQNCIEKPPGKPISTQCIFDPVKIDLQCSKIQFFALKFEF